MNKTQLYHTLRTLAMNADTNVSNDTDILDTVIAMKDSEDIAGMKDLVKELQGDGSNDNVLRDEEDDVKIENIRQDSIEEHSSILEVRQFIQSDLQPKNLNIGQQNKHIEGTNEYKQYKAKYAQKNQYGPSRLLVGIKEVQNLINQYAGTGKIKVNQKGVWNKTEVILFNDRIVGKVVNNMNGKESETTVFKIHYGNDGVHIVPDYPSKRKGKK